MEPPLLVREEKSVRLTLDTELIPDVSVVRGTRDDYRERHPIPVDTALIVEVADSSVVKDLGEKAQSYSQAGMMEYWVVLVDEEAIVVHRQPTRSGYQSVSQLAGTDTLSSEALPGIAWAINELLGRIEAQ